MTLSEMSTHVCSKVNQTETEDVTACKGFIRRRYEAIWNDQLWKDSIAQVSVTLDPDNADNAAGVVVLPEIIDRPIAIRGPDRAVLVNPLERYYRIDLDMFIRTGTQYEMALLNPAWLTVRQVDIWEDLGVSGTYTPAGPVGIFVYAGPFIVGNLYKITSGANEVSVGISSNSGTASHTFAGAGGIVYFTADALASLTFASATASIPFTGTVEVIDPDDLPDNTSTDDGGTVIISSSSGGDTSNIKIIWRDQAGKRYEQTGTLPQVLVPDDGHSFFEIEAIFKSATIGTVTVYLADPAEGLVTLGTLDPTDTRTPCYQRIRVFDIPGSTAVLRVAGKVKAESLTFDNEEPMLRSCENILLAFAQGDMLQRERHYSQAKEMYDEAIALLEQLKRVEVVQQANNRRIIPQDGFVPQWDFNGSSDLTF